MTQEIKYILLTALFSGIIAVIITIVGYDMQSEWVEKEIAEIKNQNKILSEQTQLMNQSITDFQKSLKKESLISVKVLPHVEDLYNPFGVGFKIQAGKNFVREIFPINRTIPLKADDTVKFDIVITNIGSDTAILNSYHVQVFSHGEETFAKSVSWFNEDIREPLTAGSLPKIISYELEVKPQFSPRGEIFFIVVHDNSVDESYSLKYFVVE